MFCVFVDESLFDRTFLNQEDLVDWIFLTFLYQKDSVDWIFRLCVCFCCDGSGMGKGHICVPLQLEVLTHPRVICVSSFSQTWQLMKFALLNTTNAFTLRIASKTAFKVVYTQTQHTHTHMRITHTHGRRCLHPRKCALFVISSSREKTVPRWKSVKEKSDLKNS